MWPTSRTGRTCSCTGSGSRTCPEIWRRLEAVGLDTTEACGDTPRVILGCPLAGVAEDELLDATPALQEVRERYIGDPEFSNLPRKFKTSISGCAQHCSNHEINDVAFVGVDRPGRHARLRPLGRRRAVHQPEVRPAAGCLRRAGAGRRGLGRGHRAVPRLRLPPLPAARPAQVPAGRLGYGALPRGAGEGLPVAPLPDGPAPVRYEGARGHAGLTRQVDGNYAVGFALRVGRTSGTQLARIAALAAEYGQGRIRTTAQQQLVILDVPADRTDALVAELAAEDLPVHPSPFREGTMACTGIEFCKLAIVETKARAQALYRELDRRLPDFPEPVSITVNGCPNSCARFQVADIGFKGSVARGAAARTSRSSRSTWAATWARRRRWAASSAA